MRIQRSICFLLRIMSTPTISLFFMWTEFLVIRRICVSSDSAGVFNSKAFVMDFRFIERKICDHVECDRSHVILLCFVQRQLAENISKNTES